MHEITRTCFSNELAVKGIFLLTGEENFTKVFGIEEGLVSFGGKMVCS